MNQQHITGPPDRKWTAYALTGTAILGAFAAPNAQAGVIFTPVTISGGNFLGQSLGPQETDVDLDGDTVPEFHIATGSVPDSLSVILTAIGQTQFVLDGVHPAALGFDTMIGPGSTLGVEGTVLLSDKSTTVGNWPNDLSGRYLGLEFRIGGATHYGWAELAATVGFPSNEAFLISGLAYESTPDTAITTPAPEPATMALFALGAAGIAAWKRRRGGCS